MTIMPINEVKMNNFWTITDHKLSWEHSAGFHIQNLYTNGQGYYISETSEGFRAFRGTQTQLRPTYKRFYTKEECLAMVERDLHHRQNYSLIPSNWMKFSK